ncbi:MAG: PqiC family protein [Thermodesulfobacteriota bacterium]
MIARPGKSPRWSWLLGLCLLLGGCVGHSPQARFYQLSALADGPAVATGLPSGSTIAVGPVRLPDSLDRPQLVSRSGDNELRLAEYHRWAGSLRQEVTRVVGENLARLLPMARIEPYPWHHGNLVRYQVEVTVTRLDGVLGQEAALDCQWSVVSPQENRLLLTRTTSLREPVAETDHSALVAAQSRLLGRLSGEVAEAVGQIGKSP